MLTLVPTMVFADGDTTTAPSVSVYATKAQLMDETFAPDADGYDTNIGKLAFGKNISGGSQEWYILGADTGVEGDNTAVFAAGPMLYAYFERNRNEIKTDSSLWSDCTYSEATPTEVYPNHYGSSDLRATLKNMATDTNYFTIAEQGLMNNTTVTTTDTLNSADYTTTDKLYSLHGDYDDDIILWAGSSDQIVLAMDSYWYSGEYFWLRTPGEDMSDALSAEPGNYTTYHVVNDDGTCIQPASNLNLSNVLFSSAVTATPSNDGPSVGTIDTDKAMVLRLDGSSMDIGTVEYDSTTDKINAEKGSADKVALVVQGKNGEKDWFFSVLIGEEYSLGAEPIKTAFGLSSLNLENCKIWLETVGNDGMIYAVNETKKIQSVEITNIDAPSVNTALDNEAVCATTGISSTTPSVKWTPEHTTAQLNISYTASVTLTADEGYEFTDSTTATVNGYAATSVTKNNDGTLTVTYKFPAIFDTTAPTGEISIGTSNWNVFFNGITFDLFFKDTQTVAITASDDSGEDVTIEYLLSDKELTAEELDEASFTAYDDTFSINPNNQYVIYARLTDASDNAAYINSNGIVLDNIAPVISGVENGKAYCEKQTVTVTEKYIDSVTVNGKAVTLDTNNQFTLTAAEGTQKIIATDKAGNVSAEMIVTVGHTDKDNDNKCDLCGTDININSKTETENKNMKSPETGNDINSAMWLMLLLSCGGAIIVTGAYGKRKKQSR